MLLEATAEQRDRILEPVLEGRLTVRQVGPETDPASDPAAVPFSAERRADTYVVEGASAFVAAHRAPDLPLILARTGAAGMTGLIVDPTGPGVQLLAAGRTIGGQPLWNLHLDGATVPAADRLGAEGGAGEPARRWLAVTRIRRHGARSVGIASRALEMAASYARSRVTFGRPLAARHAIRAMLADSAIETRMARLLVHEAAQRFDAGEEVLDLSAMVKIAATETATRVIDRTLQIHGGVGLTLEFPLEHWFRELKTTRISDGVNEVLRDDLAGRVVGDLPGSMATGSPPEAAAS
jgi:acyl-CoA dehydrogenase